MVSDLQVYNSDVLDYNDAPRIIWIAVREAAKLLWDENPKLHDIGSLARSFEKYGFQELPKFDRQLINVAGNHGAIKAGNGRVETIAYMENNGKELPRGIAKDKDTGAWVMPILIGVDAETIDIARAYAIDSNNLTMAGGNFTAIEIASMWNTDKYIQILNSLNVATVSITKNDLNRLRDAFIVTEEDLPDYVKQIDNKQTICICPICNAAHIKNNE